MEKIVSTEVVSRRKASANKTTINQAEVALSLSGSKQVSQAWKEILGFTGRLAQVLKTFNGIGNFKLEAFSNQYTVSEFLALYGFYQDTDKLGRSLNKYSCDGLAAAWNKNMLTDGVYFTFTEVVGTYTKIGANDKGEVFKVYRTAADALAISGGRTLTRYQLMPIGHEQWKPALIKRGLEQSVNYDNEVARADASKAAVDAQTEAWIAYWEAVPGQKDQYKRVAVKVDMKDVKF